MNHKFQLVVRNVTAQKMFRSFNGRAVFRAGSASIVGKGSDETSFGFFNKASAASKKGQEAQRNAKVYAEYCNELSRPSRAS